MKRITQLELPLFNFCSYCSTRLNSTVQKNRSAHLFLAFLSFSIFLTTAVFAQEKEDAKFKIVLRDRAAKITGTLSITDSNLSKKITGIIAKQYYNLNKVHDETKSKISAIKSRQLPEEEKTTLINKELGLKKKDLAKLHTSYIKQLNKNLSTEQVNKVKDGMTYNVLNVTYTAYQDMILTLNEKQKATILGLLTEARELAMDEGSSDDKHKVFGQYKGRINNYLSGEGIDMKAEEKAWQQRLREKREKANAENKLQSS